MYTKEKDGILDDLIDRFGIVYNHCIAIHRRYYELKGKYLNKYKLMSHLAKLSHRPHWRPVFVGTLL